MDKGMRVNVQKQMMKRLMIVMLALAACLPVFLVALQMTDDGLAFQKTLLLLLIEK